MIDRYFLHLRNGTDYVLDEEGVGLGAMAAA